MDDESVGGNFGLEFAWNTHLAGRFEFLPGMAIEIAIG